MKKSSRTSISPPPLKRQRRNAQYPETHKAPTLPSRPITALADNQLRIFTWNINGIRRFLQPSITSFFRPSSRAPESPSSSAEPKPSPTPDLRATLKRWQWPHIVCLQEVHIAPSDTQTQSALRAAVRAPASTEQSSYHVEFSLPRDRFNARGRGGKGDVHGVATLIRSDVFDRYMAVDEAVVTDIPDWDLEGRVLGLKLPRVKLVVVNVYAVNASDAPYRDPNTGQVIGTRHDFKRRFHEGLRDLVASCEKDGWGVVVAGDMNIACGQLDGFPGIRTADVHVRHRTDFKNKFMESVEEGGLEMRDSFREIRGRERKYTYRSPGVEWGVSCDRVDLILLSRGLVERNLREKGLLVEADILDEERERGPSDHLPSYVTLRFGAGNMAATKDNG